MLILFLLIWPGTSLFVSRLPLFVFLLLFSLNIKFHFKKKKKIIINGFEQKLKHSCELERMLKLVVLQWHGNQYVSLRKRVDWA